MRPLLFALIAGALVGCDDATPCDGVSGTCLYVNVQSQGNGGERVDGVRFSVKLVSGAIHEQDYAASSGGQLLPLTLGLPLPDEAEGSVCVSAEARVGSTVQLCGYRSVAELERGQHRFIWIQMRPLPCVTCQ